MADGEPISRYDRQERFAPLGAAGQARLSNATAAIVGVGGLGSALAEMLGRAGVGRLRLIDDDRVETVNLHRQRLYDQDDAAAGRLKVRAAAARLAEINEGVAVDAIARRLTPENALELLAGVDVVLDGLDDWPPRFTLNDACVALSLPWVMAGVVRAEAVSMTVVPGRSACLRCVYDAPPPPELHQRCAEVGVLGPAVSMIASVQAAEAIKILAGATDAVSCRLLRMDLWSNQVQHLDLTRGADPKCPCCGHRRRDFLHPPAGPV